LPTLRGRRFTSLPIITIAFPVRPIYKSYPVYAPGKEPAGYEDWLKQQEPETVFDSSKLKTEDDWIRAGEIVFEAPTSYDVLVNAADLKGPQWYAKAGALISKRCERPYTKCCGIVQARFADLNFTSSPCLFVLHCLVPSPPALQFSYIGEQVGDDFRRLLRRSSVLARAVVARTRP
jgi:hypothetical protein